MMLLRVIVGGVALVVGAVVMAYIVKGDCASRRIPARLCWTLGLIGCIFQLSWQGVGGLLRGIFWMCGILIVCFVAAYVVVSRTKSAPIGDSASIGGAAPIVGSASTGSPVSIGGSASTGSPASIGGGDIRCMAALSLVSGAAAPLGFLACYSTAAVWSLIQCARGRLQKAEPFAFGPFLALWFICGSVATVAGFIAQVVSG